jgi:peptidoglycan/LPS O-acetylase OafA/YrhL
MTALADRVGAVSSLGTEHRPCLDAIRASAEVMVFISHLAFYGALLIPALHLYFLNMASGVVLFFVLSGYLIYRPFVVGPVRTLPYLVRRLSRIMPAYIAALIGTTLLTGDDAFLHDPLRYLLFAQNYSSATFSHFLGVSWSLQLEMTFYLVLPFLALVLRASGRPLAWLVVLGGLSLAAAFWRFLTPASDLRLEASLFPFAFWCFVPGMVLARIEDRAARVLARPTVLVAGIGLTVAGVTIGMWATVDVFTAAGGGLLVGYGLTRSSLPWSNRWAGAAAITYSAYLWHVSLIKAAARLPLAPIVAAVATIAVATAVFRVVEKPCLSLGRSLAWRLERGSRPELPLAVTLATAEADGA